MRISNKTACRAAGWISVSLIGILATSLPTWAASPDAPPLNRTAAASSVDLRPAFERWGIKARPQGKRGTCSVFTVTAEIEYALAKSGHPGNCLSVEFLNWASNETLGKPEDGSFFSDLWNGLETYGICDEKEMPYRSKFDPKRRPSPAALAQAKRIHDFDLTLHWIKPWDPNQGLDEEQFTAIKQTLQSGWPVCGGFLWPKKAKWTEGVLGWASRDGVRDGHSVLLYGFRDDSIQPGGGVFLIRNSSRGPRHGAMSYEYVRAYMNDAVWVEWVAP